MCRTFGPFAVKQVIVCACVSVSQNNKHTGASAASQCHIYFTDKTNTTPGNIFQIVYFFYFGCFCVLPKNNSNIFFVHLFIFFTVVKLAGNKYVVLALELRKYHIRFFILSPIVIVRTNNLFIMHGLLKSYRFN